MALVTPFYEDFSIDFHSLEKVINHTIQGGVDYLVVLGTTGETPVLTAEEKKKVTQKSIEFCAGRVPVMLGLGGNSTAAVLNEIEATDFEGVSAILSVSPYYNKPTQQGIIHHFTTVADASPVPVVLYNVPGRTMSNLEADTTLALAKHSNIIGIKEASGNWEQCVKIAAKKPDDFLLISGDDMLTVALKSVGGAGVISVLANALPETFKKLCHGNAEEQKQASFDLVDFNALMYQEGNPVGIKNLLKQLQICGDQVRLPMLRASESLNQKIKALR